MKYVVMVASTIIFAALVIISIILASLLFISGYSPRVQTANVETPSIGVEVRYFMVDGMQWVHFIPPGSSMECIQRRHKALSVQCVPLKQEP